MGCTFQNANIEYSGGNRSVKYEVICSNFVVLRRYSNKYNMSRSQWTKQVVDNHVSNILKQQKDEKQVYTFRQICSAVS